jgi:hypothetical protein
MVMCSDVCVVVSFAMFMVMPIVMGTTAVVAIMAITQSFSLPSLEKTYATPF